VSHQKIRAEKRCLNCGNEVTGRFCPACGQENIEPKQTVWHLITHFFSDITHFDGKFFTTVRDLFTRPGFLSREYISGKRVSYLDPIRMYIFTSAIFFLIFFSLFDIRNTRIDNRTRTELLKDPTFRKMLRNAKTLEDTDRVIKEYRPTGTDIVKLTRDSTTVPKSGFEFNPEISKYKSLGEYDTVQMNLPSGKRDGWLKKKFATRWIDLSQRFDKDPAIVIQELFTRFLHNFPKALFISLPVFAFLLQLLYWRKKDFMYVDHGIFSIHLYIFSFLILLVIFGINQLNHFLGWQLFYWINGLITLYALIYYYKAMRKFYAQGRVVTMAKYLALLLMSVIVQFTIFMLVFIFSAFES
jgi:Protein of unknown function (DUF3667)